MGESVNEIAKRRREVAREEQLSRQAYVVEKLFAFMLYFFDVEWTGLEEEANCGDAWVVLCLLGDF